MSQKKKTNKQTNKTKQNKKTKQNEKKTFQIHFLNPSPREL